MRMMFSLMVSIALAATAASAQETISLDLGGPHLVIDAQGFAHIELGDGTAPWPHGSAPLLQLDTEAGLLAPERLTAEDTRLLAQFPGGATCTIQVNTGPGFAVFEVKDLAAPATTRRIRLCSIGLPPGTEIMHTLNAGRTPTHTVALSAAEINVHAFADRAGRSDADRAGCTHEFVPATEAKVGTGAARFTSTCNEAAQGWSVSSHGYESTLDLSGCKAIRAWICGDGKGELLKIQLNDGQGGARDAYVPIAFTGWQQVTIAESSYDTLRYASVRGLSIYYNGVPASTSVTCLVDHIEAILARDGQEQAVLLEDFEANSPFWREAADALNLETLATHGLAPARFGVLASANGAFFDTMERFETAAGLPSPKPGGGWSKCSPWIQRSYLFITDFRESQFDDVLAMAKRGGFDMILILQDSWTRATGHFEINTDRFPGGLDALAATVRRFKDAGFHVGFHFLGASIYPPDAYLTPVPDPRLVKDASAELAADIDAKADFVPTTAAPDAFPDDDGGYMGAGCVLQIGNELITYGARAVEAPFGFKNCRRAHLGTEAAAHAKGEVVRHLVRAYGYHMHDMDTTLLDEVSANFARVANACDIDMIYFDGSERLQGDHWYYNAKLHKAYFDKLARKDILLQASSFSHYSWHILSRTASADGHGDIKGYLDERSGGFDVFQHDGMPLDVGWYYGYDPSVTPDVFEYILGTTIAYNSSMSFQVSLAAAQHHPFVGDILDLIARYERLRLSGRVPQDMRQRLRIDPALAGEKTPEARAELLDLRREFRLLGEEGHEVFQRVVYAPWHEISTAPDSLAWKLNVAQGPAKIGVQFHAASGPWLAAGPSYVAANALTLESFDDLAPFLADKKGDTGARAMTQAEGGAALEGVTFRFELAEQDAHEGARCAVYTAESARGDTGGWTVVGKQFDPPIDIQWHKAIGFWLRGDGNGGLFKLQLTDGAKAADFYITNDFAGWRYQQLARPIPDPINYAAVRTLSLYYNGLPARSSVTCAVDDIKALREIDGRTLTDPWIEVGGQRIAWSGSLQEGQYVFLWPGEAIRRYGPDLATPQPEPGVFEAPALPAGEHAVRFGCAGAVLAPATVRLTLQPPEQYPIP